METFSAIDLGREALTTAIMVVAPILLLALGLAIVLGFLQSLFQVHDQTVSYVPKLVLMLGGLALGLPWMTDRLLDYSRKQFGSLENVIFVDPNSNEPSSSVTASVIPDSKLE